MAGFINSPVQAQILDFLERVGPSPCPALEILFGSKTMKHLNRLRNQGYVYNLVLAKTEFWILQDYGRFQPKQQEILAWFVARWEQGGGRYNNKVVISPDGSELMVRMERDRIVLVVDKAEYYALLPELQKMEIKHCIRKDTAKKTDKVDEGQKLFERMREIKEMMREETNPERIAELQHEFEEIKKQRK